MKPIQDISGYYITRRTYKFNLQLGEFNKELTLNVYLSTLDYDTLQNYLDEGYTIISATEV